MTYLDISAINQVYQVVHQSSITYHRVEYPALESFSKRINELQRHLWDQGYGEDDYWKLLLQRTLGFRSRLTIAPTDHHTVTEAGSRLSDWLSTYTDRVEIIYPSMAENVQAVSLSLSLLMRSEEEGLLDTIVGLMPKGIFTGLLLLQTKYFSTTQRLLTQYAPQSQYAIIDSTDLRDGRCFDRLIVIGSPRRFPEFVFTAPRSKELHVVNYKWIGTSWQHTLAFYRPLNISTWQTGHEELVSQEELIDFDLPIIDFTDIVRRVQNEIAEDDSQELEDGRIYLLDSNAATILEDDLDSSVTIIDLSESDENRIRYIKLRHLRPGMFLLLRTEAGGDYLVSIANRIMGERAEELRDLQIHWKNLLSRKVYELGFDNTLAALKNLGCKRATYPNLARWLSVRSIKTHDADDFRAIFELIGLGKQFDLYWDMMCKIVEAHRKAGFYIRNLLLQQIRESDLSDLNRQGTMRFNLGDDEAGSLTAFRLLSISDEVIQVSPWRIGEVFEMDDELWL